MDRRELLGLIGAGRAIHNGVGTEPVALSAGEIALVTRIADLVMPATDTPGALDVSVRFGAIVVGSGITGG